MRKHGKQIEILVPYNGKIFDISEADTSTHTTTSLKTALSETREIVAVLLRGDRMGGSGNLLVYPNEGSDDCLIAPASYGPYTIVIAAGSDRFQYSLSNANDDFDVHCFGYVVKQ